MHVYKILHDYLIILVNDMQILTFPYETRSAVAALQNGFKKRCRIAAKRLAAAVANFGCSGQRYEAV